MKKFKILHFSSKRNLLFVLCCWLINLSANAQTPPTWSVQSNYFGERNAISQPRTLRGMALSQDGLSVYTGLIQSPNVGTTSLRKVSSEILTLSGTDHEIFGNGMPGGTGGFAQVGGQPVYAGGLTGTFQGWINVGNSPEGIATDDRGYVFVALTSSTTNANRIDIFNSDLSSQVGTISLGGNPRGVRIHKIDATYYAYTISDNGLQRYNVTNVAGPILDGAYTPGIFSGRNLTIDLDGTVYVAGNNQVRRISPSGTLTHTSGTITNAKDVAVYYNKLYVIKTGSPSQSITILSKADLTSAGADFTVPDFGITRSSTLSQFQSIEVNSKGNLYISEENYNGTQNSTCSGGGCITSYTPPATTFNPTPGTITGRIYFDRVVTSSFVEPDYANIQVTVTGNSVEISYNDWFSVFSLDGVNYATPASNPFTITDLTPGDYTIYIKDGVGNISSETFTIEAPEVATITITADDLSKFCSQDDPEFTFQVTEGALAEGDVFSGSLERAPGETVGTYAINLGTLSLEGYEITFIPGEFTINGLEIDASASSTPVQLGSSATLTATISPAVAGVTVAFYLDDVSQGTALTNGSGVATLSPAISGLAVDVYKVEAKVGTCASSLVYLPVFDPNGSFVTGGGWINSPAGAFVANSTLTGKANFGFVARYKKGSSQVNGNTEFQFIAGGLIFQSTMHQSGSLVISGRKATYRGTGIVNGQTGFKFVVVAIDGNWNGQTNPDAFRIKISTTSDVVIYDNQMGSDENTESATTLGGGSIVIHEVKAKGGNNSTNSARQTISKEVELSSELEQGEFSLYPNPASTDTNVMLDLDQPTKVAFHIYDAMGRLVIQDEAYQEGRFTHTIKVDSLAPGMYMVQIKYGNMVMTKRLIKN